MEQEVVRVVVARVVAPVVVVGHPVIHPVPMLEGCVVMEQPV